KAFLKGRSVTSEDRSEIYKNLSGTNRFTFRRSIDTLCKSIGLDIPDSELALFVACRDSVIHAGRFYCETAREQDRLRVPPLENEKWEYFFLVRFLDR